MNTRLVMTFTSIVLGAIGIFLTFAPEVAINNLNIEAGPTSILLGQIIGGLYFGYAMLNWMAKGSLIGGIYNRPVAVANFTHFMIAGLAIIKSAISVPGLPIAIWVAGAIYAALWLLFAIILFRHPVRSSD